MAAGQELEQVRDLLTWAAAAGGWRIPNKDEREGRRKRRSGPRVCRQHAKESEIPATRSREGGRGWELGDFVGYAG
jgi:hypothetical protein